MHQKTLASVPQIRFLLTIGRTVSALVHHPSFTTRQQTNALAHPQGITHQVVIAVLVRVGSIMTTA